MYSPFTIYRILIIPLDTVTGGVIAGIVIAAVVFVLLLLILIAVIVYYIYLRSKKWKSTFIVCENNHTNDGDLQAEYRQLERLKRGVRRILERDCTFVFFKTVVDKMITI